MSQPTGPMIINLPQPPSNPDTPNEMPGTPTSTTTSLSALSTTAIKDGHRGHAHAFPGFGTQRGHSHNPSTNSLEAERADRISRLAGLERVSTLRAGQQQQGQSGISPQTTPTSTGFPSGSISQQQIGALPSGPSYFDSNGQPVAATKMSTVGTASATGSVGARTTTDTGDATEVDEDVMSMDTNYRTMDVDSSSGADVMDDDLGARSVGGYEDRMSDDGTASLVGFGEGANSTVSGPIYQRRPLPGTTGATGAWGLERSSSGLSEAAMLRSQQLRDAGDTPVSAIAQAERRDARMMNGIAVDGGGHTGTTGDDTYVDTTATGPVPATQLGQGMPGSVSREAERIVHESLDAGEGHVGVASPALSSTKGGERLGQFYFEEKK
ncbi:hypothetical protein PFICI_14565 [Pestalotiopsis fici W106-1]|uniref:Uncharacterized protein n=1 Tax=Pestalotiopsis fici (strain W106-1 / CGMCC3.15140) TaxID=1229662 RepID=W3WIK6_PESFW|nr:uncharacterized protein PFICI_14565 [Pestalotiopsis fici W106-1]ETS73619.1 hypothetical protein PFICI_14565 [Pestalotiopsis fici W106-1]